MSLMDVTPNVKEKRIRRIERRIEVLTQSARRARAITEGRLEQIKLEEELLITLRGYAE